jgi:hypothetical protein
VLLPSICQYTAQNVKIKIYRTIVLLAVSYGCEILSLTLKKEGKLMALENRVLREIFGHKRDEVTEGGEGYTTTDFMICTAHRILFG